jgi:hypothetical protein
MDTLEGYASLTKVELLPVEGGFHVRSLGQDRCIHVSRMLVNWRLGLWHGLCDNPMSYQEYYWCYQGTGKQTFLRIVGAALSWDGTPENPPGGWIKSYTGEYRGDRRV